ncbi:O-acyltransferase like protein-like [Liolophura sinensis]|uniref:O-acyltransferase like protein-like n=1 Tax=Liolophura sinensis TaxID=3198878 RepID=UPI0031594ABF
MAPAMTLIVIGVLAISSCGHGTAQSSVFGKSSAVSFYRNRQPLPVSVSGASDVTTLYAAPPALASTPTLPPRIQLALQFLKDNPAFVQKFMPLWEAIQPYFRQVGISNNPLLPQLTNEFWTLLLVDFPRVLNSTLTHQVIDDITGHISKISLTGVDNNNAADVIKALLIRFPWKTFVNDLYVIAKQDNIYPSHPSLQTRLKMVLLNFTLGTLPSILINPLVRSTEDIISKHVMAVNLTGVDTSHLGPVVEAVFFQVDWSEVLLEFYGLLRKFGLYPQTPSIRFTIESLLLNFTLDTVPAIVKNPFFQALDRIVMGQIRKMNLTGIDPRNVGQLLSTILIQLHPEEIISKVNALPGVQNPEKTVIPINKHCVNDITMAYQALLSGKSWALQMLDATGKPGAGILKGNLYMVGNYDQCLSVSVRDTQTIIRRRDKVGVDYERFKGHYCRLTVDLPKSFVTSLGVDTHGIPVRLSWGLCLPNTCAGSDVKAMLTSGFMSQIDISVRDVFCGNDANLSQDGSAIAAIVILSILLALTAIGTLVEIIVKPRNATLSPSSNGAISSKTTGARSTDIGHTNGGYVSEKAGHNLRVNGSGPVEENHNGVVQTSFSMENEISNIAPGSTNDDVMMAEAHTVKAAPRKRESLAVKLWLSFSLLSNVPKILAATHPKGSITCLNGIRYLSMAWVILCHTFYYGVFSISENQTAENMIDAPGYLQRFTFMPLVYGTFSVDTFFVLSGFLVAYLFFKDIDKRKGRVTCAKMVVFYVHRFWRLTPIYMIVIMMFTGLHKYVIFGPLLPRDMSNAENCKTNWWTNLLYINNLVRVDDMCMGWTWYLANDMQFYIISPVFILALYFFPVVGVILTSLLVAASITSTAIIENRGAGNMLNIKTVAPGKPNYYNDIYVKPWCRVGAYAIGLLLAFIMYKRGQRKLSVIWATLGWVIALTVGLFLVYCGYTELQEGGQPWSQPVRTAYESLSRPAFAACVSWVIYACHTGRGGYINSILSWKGLIPLARLTYAAYLIHPVIMFMYMYRRSALIYLSDYVMVYFYLGHLSIAYASAFILSVLFESPFLGLEKIILKLLGA